VHRPAKVCNLDLAIEADEEILRLDVAVNDMLERKKKKKKMNT